jgi:electron transport complex protein RnfD
LRDGSALLTGLLLGLILPPAIPLWIAFLGGVVAVGLGKLVWGGLGNNLFNPALVGRAFLQASFPTAITTWTLPNSGFLSLQSSTLAAPLMQGSVDAATAATPLGLMKFQQQMTPYHELILGNTAGSLGETSGLAILLGGVYLLLRRSIDWRIPTGIVLSAGIFATLLFMVDGNRFPDPLFVVFSGSLLFGAIFMATDPVTSPLTPKGTWWFAIGIGTLIVLIRAFGGLPEGVMYAILLMNAATPLISRYSQPRVFGHR